MSFSLILLMGLMIVCMNTIFRNNLLLKNSFTDNAICLLSRQSWFQGPWLSGLFLFAVNALLFSSAVLLFYSLIFIQIPYFHIAVMGFAVYVSILAWFSIGKSFDGTRRNQLKMGLIGSSFYVLVSALIIYKECHLKPVYPGDDTFMAVIGLLAALIVSAVAFIVCLVFTAFSGKRGNV
ncbi:hypothetical protein ACN6MY_10735 [Peribacillus sp. B-H-3]|uniref:hypothetical protein n=1 Tax=Peribacillus sp. B-H-3 TaxID=3400420 RepID=UPI003B0222D5